MPLELQNEIFLSFGGLSDFRSTKSQMQFFFPPCCQFLADNGNGIAVFTTKYPYTKSGYQFLSVRAFIGISLIYHCSNGKGIKTDYMRILLLTRKVPTEIENDLGTLCVCKIRNE